MQVKCVLCDKIEEIESQSLQAKRLRNRRKYMHICTDCYERIEKNTKQRHATGNFRLYKERKQKDDLI